MKKYKSFILYLIHFPFNKAILFHFIFAVDWCCQPWNWKSQTCQRLKTKQLEQCCTVACSSQEQRLNPIGPRLIPATSVHHHRVGPPIELPAGSRLHFMFWDVCTLLCGRTHTTLQCCLQGVTTPLPPLVWRQGRNPWTSCVVRVVHTHAGKHTRAQPCSISHDLFSLKWREEQKRCPRGSKKSWNKQKTLFSTFDIFNLPAIY